MPEAPKAASRQSDTRQGTRRLRAPQMGIALAALILLEAAFAAMAHLRDLSLEVIPLIALALAAGIVYFLAIYALEHSAESLRVRWLIIAGALLFRLTLLPLAPTLSTDLYRYQWDGRLQQSGRNPYLVEPRDPSVAPLRDYGWTVMPGQEMPSMYPPGAQIVFGLDARLFRSALLFKLPFLLADVLVLAILAKWLFSIGGRNYQLAIYAWNPLVILEFAGSSHNDAVAIAGMVAGLALMRNRKALANLCLSAGACVKLFPITLLPAGLRLAGWPRRVRGWLALAGCAVVAGACLWPYRSAIPAFPSIFSRYQAIWQNYNPSLYGILLWLTQRREIASGIGEGVVLGLAIWAAARQLDLLRAAYILIGAILMLAPNGYSWYFTWIVPLLCFFPNPAWMLLTILQFLSYKVLIRYRINGIWHFDPFFQWLTYAPFYALLIGEWLLRKKDERKEEQATQAECLPT